MFVKKLIRMSLSVCLMVALPVLVFVLAIGTTLAHGSMLRPISRVYACYLENPETPDTLACRDAIAAGGTQPLYDWNEVHILNAAGNHQALIPDGKLCSAGQTKYAAFDQPRPDWARTVLPASGTYTFLFAAYVPHNMGYFELYVTRNGYDPLQPLKWSDLEATPFLRVDNPPVVNGNYQMTGQLPAGKSGHHVIYGIWQRNDSAEAFYSCSDVWFGSAPTPTSTPAPVCSAPLWSASVVYQAGDQVRYDGRLWQARWSSSGQVPSTDGATNAWRIQGYCSGSGSPATATPSAPASTPTPTSNTVTSTATPTPVTTTQTPTPIFTATVTNTPSSAACAVTYVKRNDWGNGATIDVTIRNTSAVAINGWTLTWTFSGNQQINNLWNGAYTQSGVSVSVSNAAWNRTISANGGTANFGFNIVYSGTNAVPTSFSLNGTPCQ
jgi:predicted carbohydrate-binding protein with CBM5 and CBM33 domain